MYKYMHFSIFSWIVNVEGNPEGEFCVILRNMEHLEQTDFSLASLAHQVSKVASPLSSPLLFFIYPLLFH